MISISILPRLLLAPIAGVFGDWFDRKKIITLLNFANSLIIGAFAVIYILNESLTVGLIYLFVILLEITEIFFHSSESAVLPSIVTKDQMMDANATNSLIMNIGQLLSPMLASILYGSFGLKIILITSSISFLLSAISKLFMDIPKTNVAPEKINLKAFRTDLMEGIKIIKSNKKISSIIGIGTIVNFCISPLMSIGLIYIIKGILKTTDFQFGLFQSVVSLSLIAAPLFCSGFIKKIKLGNLCFMSFFSIAILILAMALVPASFILDLPIESGYKWNLFLIVEDPVRYTKQFVELLWKLHPIFEESYGKMVQEVNEYGVYLENFLNSTGADGLNQITFSIVDATILNPDMNHIIISAFIPLSLSIVSSDVIDYIAWGLKMENAFKLMRELNENKLNERVQIFKNLGDKTRYEVLKLIASGETSTKNIANALGVSSATISYHMNALLTSKIVCLNKNNNKIGYHIDKDLLNQVFQDLMSDLEIPTLPLVN